MNKLFTKIASLALGAAMAFGVGVAVSSKEAAPVEAANGSVTLTTSFFSMSGTSYVTKSATDSTSGVTFNVTDCNVNSGLNMKKSTGEIYNSTAFSNKKITSVVLDGIKFSSASSAGFYVYGGTSSKPSNLLHENSGSTTKTTVDFSSNNYTYFYIKNKGTRTTAFSSVVINYTDAASDYVGSLSVSPSTWTGFDSQTLSVSSFTVSGSKNGTAGAVTSSDYEYKGIGYMSGGNFVARDANFSSGNPTTADTRLAWKAKYPTTSGGSTYAWAYVTLTVSADSVNSIAISGSMTKTTYNQGDAWDPAGFTVKAYYASAPSTPVDVTNNAGLSWTYSPATTASTSTTSVTCTASFGGKSATSSAQSVTVNEKQNLGGLVDGEKYFIIANGRYLGAFNSVPGAPAGTSKAWPGDANAPTSDDDAWLFTATSTEDNWLITSKAGNTLYATGTNNGLGCTSSGNDNWTVHDTANGLKVTASNGRYLTQYGESNFRVYTSTTGQTEADSTIRFVKYVAPASIESVEFTGSMTKTEYYVGDSWDYSGLSLQANLSDDTTENLGTVASLIQSGDLEIEASPSVPALNVTSVTLSALYGQDLLEAELVVTGITVSTPRTLEGVTLDGDMETKNYQEGADWDVTGLYLTLSYNVGLDDTVNLTTLTKGTDYLFDHDTAVSGDTSIYISGEYQGFEFDKTVTGIVVTAIPGVINFGTSSGYWQPASTGSTFEDNLGHTSTVTSDSTAWSTRGPSYQQIGSNSSPASYVDIVIALGTKKGIDSFSITFSSSGANSVALSVYGDNVDDVILSGEAPDTTNVTLSTGASYEKVNATNIHIEFTPTKGIKLTSISYTLGSQAQEFGTLASIEVASVSEHATTFEVDHTFSSEGLVIKATDTVGFEKNFTTGFTTDYDGVTFDEIAQNVEVTVTMTIGLVTKTTSYYINVIDIPEYTLASSQDDLYEGMSVLIAYVNGDSVYTAGALSGDYLSKVDGSTYGDDIRAGEGSYEFVVEYYGSNILLKHGSSYLKYNSDKKVSFASTISEDCVWTYDGEKLQSVAHQTYYMQYNTGSPRFTVYTGSQQDVGLYISSATPYSAELGAATYAAKYLHMRDYLAADADGSCMNDSANHYYSTAKTQYGNLSVQEKTAFASLTEAVARLQAWARANSESFDPSTGFGNANGRLINTIVGESGSTVTIIVVTSMIGLSAVGGYFFLRKRKEI